MKITTKNYYEATSANFKGLTAKQTQAFLSAYYQWRRKKVKPETVTVEGVEYTVDYVSAHKSAYWVSRSISIYFLSVKGKKLVRISDHWSQSKYERSNKLNCGYIKTCYWTNTTGEHFESFFPGSLYASVFVGGLIPLSKMKRNANYQNFDKTKLLGL